MKKKVYVTTRSSIDSEEPYSKSTHNDMSNSMDILFIRYIYFGGF